MLVDKNILKNRTDKTYDVFTNRVTSDFLRDPTLPLSMKPSDYVEVCWQRYKAYVASLPKKKRTALNALNGKMFEVIVATAFYRSKIRPFYLQAYSQLVPDVDYDIIMYDKDNDQPITISVKTSSRERYKQADLEAYAFSNVFRSSANYLIMLDAKDCSDVQKKIDDGVMLGLDKVIQANADEFNEFVAELKKKKLGVAPSIKLFEGTKIK